MFEERKRRWKLNIKNGEKLKRYLDLAGMPVVMIDDAT